MSMQVMFSSSTVFLFMLLLMCCGSGGVVCAEEVNSVSQSNSVELFKKGETRVSESGGVASSFSAHSLVDVGEHMVAIAKRRFSNVGYSNGDDGILSKLLKYEKDKLSSELTESKENQQMAQTVVSRKTNESYYTELFGPSAVVKDNKIYILLSNFTRPETNDDDDSDVLLTDLELVVGTIGTSTGDNQGTITWQGPTSLKNTLNTALSDGSWEDVYASRGKGLLVGGSTIVFPIRAVKNGDIQGSQSYACTVIYSDDGNNWKFPSKKVIAEGCIRSTLFEQGWKLFMVTIALQFHTSKVHISSDNGKTWTEGTEADSNLLADFLRHPQARGGGDVITATINNKDVTLLAQHVYISSSGSQPRTQVHLFMTDNKRMTSVGPISPEEKISSFCTLLQTEENGGLFALCDKGSWHSQSVVLFSLTEQLERIKFVLKSWKSADEKTSRICIPTGTENEKSYNTCRGYMPTSGLVGFLSNTGDSTHWADEYLGVNATVSGGTKVENGFKLSGSRAFIGWEIGNAYPTPLYSFADRGLTLVATVTIHDIPTKTIPLMSVGLESKTVGLWYGKDGEWKGVIGGEGTGTWEKDKPYQVAITVLKGAGSVYIDGKCLGGLDLNFRPDEDGMGLPRPPRSRPSGYYGDYHHPEEPRYMCFGECVPVHNGDENTAASSFTVTNVFLYNRVLSEDEIRAPEAGEPDTE